MDETQDDNYKPTAEGESIPSSVKSEPIDVREQVEETETGFMLQVSTKRGTDTRDEDSVKAYAKGETWDEVESQRKPMRDAVMEEMTVLRNFQPDGTMLPEDEQHRIGATVADAKQAMLEGDTSVAYNLMDEALAELLGDPPEVE